MRRRHDPCSGAGWPTTLSHTSMGTKVWRDPRTARSHLSSGRGQLGRWAVILSIAQMGKKVLSRYFATASTMSAAGCAIPACHADSAGNLAFRSASEFHVATINVRSTQDRRQLPHRTWQPGGELPLPQDCARGAERTHAVRGALPGQGRAGRDRRVDLRRSARAHGSRGPRVRLGRRAVVPSRLR